MTLVCAISPPGGDLSEPVAQASLRVAGALWALDAGLAHQRQFPAVDWRTSYSLDAERVQAWFAEQAGADWAALRRAVLDLLEREAELREIAGLLGADALQERDRLTLEVAAIAREDLLGQSAVDPDDAHSPVSKTYRLAELVCGLRRAALAALDRGADLEALDVGAARRSIGAVRRAGPDQVEARAEAARAVVAGLDELGGTR